MSKGLIAVSEQLVEHVARALPDDVSVTVSPLAGAMLEACGRRADAIVVVVQHDGSEDDDAKLVGALRSLARVSPKRGLLRAVYVAGPGARSLCATSDLFVPLPSDPKAFSDLLAEDFMAASVHALQAVDAEGASGPASATAPESGRSPRDAAAKVERETAMKRLEEELDNMRVRLRALSDESDTRETEKGTETEPFSGRAPREHPREPAWQSAK